MPIALPLTQNALTADTDKGDGSLVIKLVAAVVGLLIIVAGGIVVKLVCCCKHGKPRLRKVIFRRDDSLAGPRAAFKLEGAPRGNSTTLVVEEEPPVEAPVSSRKGPWG